jgi:hypothetical protein
MPRRGVAPPKMKIGSEGSEAYFRIKSKAIIGVVLQTKNENMGQQMTTRNIY